MYNDAHASLRGFAHSKIASSMVLSAGMNPRLYSYIEEFDDFFPDENGVIRKKIILKVSDFRSAMIQGIFWLKRTLGFRIQNRVGIKLWWSCLCY